MTIRPLHDCVLIKKLTAEDDASARWFLPDTSTQESFEALVVTVGSGRILENGKAQALCVKPGDRVLIAQSSGTEVMLDGARFIVVREDEILGVLDLSTHVTWSPKIYCSATTPAIDLRSEHGPKGHGQN